MARLKHGIRNRSDKPQFVNFELSTARYRLLPGDELYFFYESEMEGSVAEPLVVDFIENYGLIEIVLWTNFGSEEGPFLLNGDEAVPDYNGP